MTEKRTVVYTDGSCLNQHDKATRRAGYAVFFGVGDPRNVSEPVPDDAKHTNQVGEMMAVIAALERTKGPLMIVSDSDYVIRGLVGRDGSPPWHKKWIRSGWMNAAKKPVENRALWERMIAAFKGRDVKMHFQRAHVGQFGNEAADALARRAAALVKKRKR